MEIINYNKIKDQIKKFSCDTDINMWHAGYNGLDCGCLVEKFRLYYAYIGECKPGVKKIVGEDWAVGPRI